MVTDMLGNQIHAGVGSVQDFIENHHAGKIRVVAVLGTQRQAALPDVPTFDELGLKGFEDLPYYGIYAPKGTPAAELKRLSDGVAQVLALPEVRTQLTALGLTVEYMTGEQLAKRQHAYTQAWTRIIETSGFKPQ
jgi:tripartite-type tricarboxylate transporter receptor subunit TctC